MNISLSGQAWARATNRKFSGVFIDDKLKLSSKVSQSSGIMWRISLLVPVKVLLNLCYTFIYSRLTCAITAQGSTFNSTIRRVGSHKSRAISLMMDQSNTNRLEMSPKFIQSKSVYDSYVLCKMFRIVCERKYEHFIQTLINNSMHMTMEQDPE